jgi:hypothetical protein
MHQEYYMYVQVNTNVYRDFTSDLGIQIRSRAFRKNLKSQVLSLSLPAGPSKVEKYEYMDESLPQKEYPKNKPPAGSLIYSNIGDDAKAPAQRVRKRG